MRNLTKVLALVLALTMMVSVAGFAASYTDVAADANYAEAVDVLSDLGLVKGYEDGTFGADKTLTRAEGTAFVLRLMGLEEAAVAAQGTETGFTDVPADHWASGYVYVAAQNGVVAGMGDGTFEPDTELTYAQIVKMIVVALGYYPLASELGEWPGNYISAGSQIKLTTGIPGKADEAVTRGTTARLLYSALTIPKMEKSGVGVTATWEAGETMILDDLGIYKIIGEIDTVDVINETATLTPMKQCFALEGKYVEKAATDDWTFEPAAKYETGALTAELKSLVDIPAIIYIADDGDDLTIVSIVERKNLVETTNLSTDDYAEYDEDTKKVTYYTNPEQTKKATFKLDNSVSVRINGGDATSKSADEFVADILEGAYVLEVKDTDGNGKVDLALATAYKFMVVDEIEVNKSGVYTITSEDLDLLDSDAIQSTLKIDTEDEETAITIVNENGEEVAISDIAEGDILNIVPTEMSSTTAVQAKIIVSNTTVDATVKYVDDDVIAMTDGSEYDFIISSTPAPQTEATFYINVLGQIIYVGDETANSKYEYAYATNLYLEGKGNVMKSGTIHVLTAAGEWATLDLKTKFEYNNVATKIDITEIDEAAEISALATTLGAVASVADAREPEYALNRVIAYKLDSTGAVKEIIADAAVMNTVLAGTASANTSYNKTYKEYDEGNEYGAYIVDETTVIYNIAEGADVTSTTLDDADVTVADMSILKNDQAYTGVAVYNVSDKTDVIGVMVGTFEADVDFEAATFIANKKVDMILDGTDKEVTAIMGFENGEAATYYFSTDDDSEIVGVAVDFTTHMLKVGADSNLAAISEGTIMIVNANSEGIINKAVVLGDTDTYVDADNDYEFDNLVLRNGEIKIDGEDEGYVVAGFVGYKSNSIAYLTDDIADYNDEALKTTGVAARMGTDMTVTVVDYSETKFENKVYAGSASDIAKGNYIIARADEDGRLVNVIVITNEQDF